MHGAPFGEVPDWYADLKAAEWARVDIDTWEDYPLYRKYRVWAAMEAEGKARKVLEKR